MKKIFLFILFCLSVCSMSAYDFLRAVKDEIPGGYNFWVYTPVDYFYSQEHTPVIIFLHGASLCGRNLDKVRRYGPLDAIVKGRDIDALMTHPAVVECAITGVPDEIRGMVVKATVVLHNDWKAKAGDDLIKELQNHVKHVTAPYKYPRIIEFVDELPKTISGKIRRVEIREKDKK